MKWMQNLMSGLAPGNEQGGSALFKLKERSALHAAGQAHPDTGVSVSYRNCGMYGPAGTLTGSSGPSSTAAQEVARCDQRRQCVGWKSWQPGR